MTDDMVVRSPALARALPLRRALPTLRLLPGVVVVALFLLWADHNGGYDTDTWYWGALLSLALVTVTVACRRASAPLSRAAGITLALFGLYVAWSYLSITWAAAPGVALQGSNRALLYLLLFSLMLLLPWGRVSALLVLALWASGIGVLAIALIVRLAANDDVGAMLVDGRLASPTGYLNSTAALFTMGALVSTILATQRRLPGPLRGLLLAFACADLQLTLIVQSRGWLFTLPIVTVVTIVLVRDRLRVAAFALAPLLGAAVILHRLLAVYSSSSSTLGATAVAAGRASLLVCFAVFVAGTLLAWGDWLLGERGLSPRRRKIIGTLVAIIAAGGATGAAVAATDGHPVAFVVRQWNGFSHQSRASKLGSHFAEVGSGRYDFWRVSLDALAAHPVGGLGQDNFDDFYIVRARTAEEPSWTHSLEMRLLVHTGVIGFALFAGFMGAALRLVLRARRRADPAVRALVAIALLPLVVWLVHGSVDWFWEMPALSGPALAFLGMASSVADSETRVEAVAGRATSPSRRWSIGRSLAGGAAVSMLIAATVALGLPYLATRLMSIASDTAAANPAAALSDLRRAAELDPLNSDPTRTAGEIALQTGRYRLAAAQFRETLAREPGDWFADLGSGLAASALGDRVTARRDFAAAYRINQKQSTNRIALERVNSRHPLTYAQALNLISAGN